MALPTMLQDRLRIPVVAAPMFIVSGPELVIAQCQAGVVGSFPALNARPQAELEVWLKRIGGALEAWNREHPQRPAAPYAVNQIVHKSNSRLEHDVELCTRYRVPIVITSLGARRDLNDAVHSYGGIVLHDVINDSFARKAIEKGADGLIAVAAGAGGHAGATSPFALIQEIREWFDGPLLLSGAIATGRAVLAAQAMGADLAYIGSAFIATTQSNADPRYKQMIVDSRSADVLYTKFFSGVFANYLKPSIVNAGLDPEKLHEGQPVQMNFADGEAAHKKVWKDIWGCGHGIGVIKQVDQVESLVARLEREYRTAKEGLLAA